MHIKHLSTAFFAMAVGTCAFTVQADGNYWSPNQPNNGQWQSPNWGDGPSMGGMNMPSFNSGPSRYNYNRPSGNRPPANRPPPGYYGARNPQQQNRPAPAPAPNMNRPPNRQMNQNMPPPPQGPYNPGSRGPVRDNGASAYNMPGYNRSRNYNRRNNNKFWGGSGPSTWMNPSKRNWENSWDDMINSPSRMGEMPGGWTAPEVSVPNPIDMGDQMQDNLEDLPEQMKDGNIGNDISD
jgi:hypothetical protein